MQKKVKLELIFLTRDDDFFVVAEITRRIRWDPNNGICCQCFLVQRLEVNLKKKTIFFLLTQVCHRIIIKKLPYSQTKQRVTQTIQYAVITLLLLLSNMPSNNVIL